MAVLVDQPLWHNHGSAWAHLVSDTSLAELKEFARGLGLPDGAFDLDHYDIPESRISEAVAAGARQVTRRELIEAIQRAGLRIPAHDRGAARQRARMSRLTQQWSALGQELGVPEAEGGRWASVGSDLLSRWSESHRAYHTPEHLGEMLGHVRTLAGPASPEPAEILAVWFHDAVYTGAGGGADERHSADLAELLLTGTAAEEHISRVRDLVVMTEHHLPDTSDDGACRVSDADLAILGQPHARYERYMDQVRREFAGQLSVDEWLNGRAAVLQKFIRTPRLFFTEDGHNRWEEPARQNMQHELAQLEGRGQPTD